MSSQPDDEALLNLQERLYEPVEVGFILGLQQETVQKLCREGKISARKMGKGWRITKEEIRRYMREGPLDPNAGKPSD